MRDPILAIHVAAGAAGLALGPIVLRALVRSDPRRFGHLAYQVAIALTVASAIALASLDWSRLWWLAAVAVTVEAAALAGAWTGHARFAGWRGWRVRLTGGTYVGLVTALLVVSWGTPFSWLLPTLVGIPLIERAASVADRTGEE